VKNKTTAKRSKLPRSAVTGILQKITIDRILRLAEAVVEGPLLLQLHLLITIKHSLMSAFECFLCHADGPRAIRANFESEIVKNSLKDKLVIFL